MVKNQANQVIGAQMVNANTGVAFVGTVTVYVTGDGGTQVLGAVGSGVCTAEGNGYYTYRPSQAETNFTLIAFTFVGFGSVPATIQVATVSAAAQAAVAGTSGVLAYTVRSIVSDALLELGVLEAGEQMNADHAMLGLRRVQAMIDSWAADRLTLSLQKRTPFVWAGGPTAQVGPGQTVNIDRPTWINTLTYVLPTTGVTNAPAIEVPIGLLDEDSYASISIKALVSALPTQAFYQTNRDDNNGTLFVWPQIAAGITLVLYTPQATAVPATLDSILQGPAGYADAFHYHLALRLCSPLGVAVPTLLPRQAAAAMEIIKKPNVSPGVLSIDAALMPGIGAGYNVLTDGTSTGQR